MSLHLGWVCAKRWASLAPRQRVAKGESQGTSKCCINASSYPKLALFVLAFLCNRCFQWAVVQTGEFQLAKPKTKSSQKLTKSALIQAILNDMGEGWVRKDILKVLDSLTRLGHTELKKRGEFVLPGFAKFVLVKKPATPARQGINPFTKEPTTFAAKPARRVIKARPVKALKDSVA